jgi:hypothetical protein
MHFKEPPPDMVDLIRGWFRVELRNLSAHALQLAEVVPYGCLALGLVQGKFGLTVPD